MYTLEQQIGGRFSETYKRILHIANTNVQQKAIQNAWKSADMDRWHMEAHREDMMRSFDKR